MKKIFIILTLLAACAWFGSTYLEAAGGCCAGHGGVAYCSGIGRVICNDGTASPTCTCRAEDLEIDAR